jgi:hypothetical protein
MTRPALPSAAFPIIDAENNATVSFNEWEGFVDGQVIALGISTGRREPLPPGAIIMAAKPVTPYARWLGWVNRSAATFGTPTQRPPLPPSNVQLVGVDRKATIPFQTWLQYIDKLLG